ncbi:hypothetical protein UFOVP35_32 [uncultured Caudovirales phage]|uniref:Uncharacterized protein n=1 Tax=uncultured Caudovirales phage TaxID=2100421 RepID=A0A6J5KMW7_9CAUD|nr:hypothetical protein UFOVP35_32 [uncultured Caudovirales phage]CAB4124418.1 hypothetical protein UFOVP52_15 [uncultured Caudovirales phage]CAB5219838.1 hypothetical protein UFOVP234_40 [uncultured Caudovirales phage]
MQAYVMTYDSLVENIQSYLERTDTATLEKIPLFIMLTEQIIASQIKFLGNLAVNTGTLIADQPIVDKPARWHKTVSFNITNGATKQPVLLRKYEYLREYWPDPTQTDTPLYYADYDYTHWLVAPTPSTPLQFEVLYYERIQPLDSSNQTNWFTVYAPQALLYGSLLQAMPFLKNDERMPMWQQNYDLIMGTLKQEDSQRIGDRQAIALDS